MGGELPRATLFCSYPLPPSRGVEGPEPGLLIPLDDAYRPVKLPNGAIGAKYVEEGSWLVRWKGERGDGWSLSLTRDLSDHRDQEPRWVSARVERSDAGRLVVGERKGGTCDVVRTEMAVLEGVPKETTGSSCDVVLAEVVAQAKAQRARVDGARDKARAEQDAINKAERAERDRLTAEEAKKSEDRRKKEEPIMTAYASQIAKGDHAAACRILGQLPAERHAELALAGGRSSFDDLRVAECARARPVSAASARRLDDAIATIRSAIHTAAGTVREPSARERVGGGIGAGVFTETAPSAASVLKQTNETTYGTGKASTCPYTDRSLCKK